MPGAPAPAIFSAFERADVARRGVSNYLFVSKYLSSGIKTTRILMMDQNVWQESTFCPRFQRAVELIGGRWSGAIIRALLGGVTRFSDLSATIPGISDRMLSERLKELEAEGLVERTVYPDIPVRIEYLPTEKGRSLGSVMESISHWADSWIQLEQAETKEPATSA